MLERYVFLRNYYARALCITAEYPIADLCEVILRDLWSKLDCDPRKLAMIFATVDLKKCFIWSKNKGLYFSYKLVFERVLTDPCEESYDQITKG